MGQVIWVNGPVVRARGSQYIGMLEMVEIGDAHLIGEVIGLEHDVCTIQVYEETAGLRPGAPIYSTGMPLSVELGPGLLQSVFDGIQRPLPVLKLRSGAFISRGVRTTSLYHKQKWAFTPRVQVGDVVQGGSFLGTVPETPLIEHRILTPPDIEGVVMWVAPPGDYTVVEPIVRLKTDKGVERELMMLQYWPVRRPRPYARLLPPNELLVTGQRVLDTFFPLSKGGTAAIPGGFGAGKSMMQHQIAKWSNVNIVVYVGCGERGNEITQVLQDFPKLIDPHTGRALMERTILVANTSNMPVAAREASIYTGVTLAEYYRDMGYHVALMADSTSRWAEALREISARLEEMPAEEGYPAYLATRLAGFYERAARVRTLSGAEGSVSIIGAVSPPGADFSEPVTQHTTRFVRCFWALDKELASARHFPSINWLDSYSEYVDEVAEWWRAYGAAHIQIPKSGEEGQNAISEWHVLRKRALELLQRESELQQIVKLVGPDALPDDQRLILETARILREGFLQQSALDNVDTYSIIEKQVRMLHLIMRFHDLARRLVVKGCPTVVIHNLPVVNMLVRMKTMYGNAEVNRLDEVAAALERQIREIEQNYV
ncbi:MAG: V-type ATP synthase subunit A [Anaerolineae bacterium]|nr:V-type ATP synthase subunit A [Anaerolineae bacterium]